MNADAITTEKNRAIAAEKVNADNLIAFKTNLKNVLVCGDSFTAGSHTDWIKYIHKYNVSNYAVNGAGLTRPNSVFTQLENAHSAFPDSDSVYMLILYCGVNDFNHRDETTENAGDKLVEWITQAVSYFPNTKIVVCYGNVGRQYSYSSSSYSYVGFYSWLTGIYDTVYNSDAANLVSMINPSSWLKYNSGVIHEESGNYQSDDLHPTVAGAKIIASYMQAIMDGCYAFRPSTKFVTYTEPIDLFILDTTQTDNKKIVGSASDVSLMLTVTEDTRPTIVLTTLNYTLTDTESIGTHFVFFDSEQLGDITKLCADSLAEVLYTKQRIPMYEAGWAKNCIAYSMNYTSAYDGRLWFCFRYVEPPADVPDANILTMRM